MLDLDHLRVFLQLAQKGSVSAAAKALNTSRARVRRKLEELEVITGTKLMERTSGGVNPTASGEVLAAQAAEIIGRASVLLLDVRSANSPKPRWIRVAVRVGYPADLLAKTVGLLLDAVPDTRIQILASDRPLSLVPDQADAAVVVGHTPAPEGYTALEIWRLRQRLLASPRYLKSHGTPQQIEDLRDHPLIYWFDGECTPGELHLRRGGRFEAPTRTIGNDEWMLRQLALRGSGIAYLPELRAQTSEPEQLVPLLADDVGRELPLRLIHPTSLVPPLPHTALLALVRKAFELFTS